MTSPGHPPFVGRERELRILDGLLAQVRQTGQGRMVAIRGRRQVGKSRLVEVFCERAGVRTVFFQATRRRLPALEVEEFGRIAAASFPDSAVLAGGRYGTWDAALAAAAAETGGDPLVVVLDELPWLIEGDPTVEGTLQKAWDRRLRSLPVLVVLIGSDLSMMEALSAYGRPLYDRARLLPVAPLAPSEVHRLVGGTATEALDTYLVVGGLPNLVHLASRARSLRAFLIAQLEDPTSPLIVAGERALAAEFPPELQGRAVLNAIGAGEREHGAIARTSGVGGATLSRALDALVAKRAVAKLVPYSAHVGGKRTRYLVSDPYLRFWLRYVGPALAEIERGRGRMVADRLLADFPGYRGKAVEPVVREAATRLLPDTRFGAARHLGAFWTRDGRVEVDLVGGRQADRAEVVEFVGSVKWRDRAPFGDRDLAALAAVSTSVPGVEPGVRLVGVSRSGFTTAGLAGALGPEDILAAW